MNEKNTKLATLLIEKGADINVTISGYTPLSFAQELGLQDIVSIIEQKQKELAQTQEITRKKLLFSQDPLSNQPNHQPNHQPNQEIEEQKKRSPKS